MAAFRPIKKTLNFSVDSALLRELGERLVGKPHIALAELVKNSYDADATTVIIRLRPDRIEILDDGHGMDFEAFESFWMRIGSPHKQHEGLSPVLKRPLTGSKGVGRLAVQFLAREIDLISTSVTTPNKELCAHVNWDEAVRAKDLTLARAEIEQRPQHTLFPNSSRHGTVIRLANLNQPWPTEAVVALAKEIWSLQPPFRSSPNLKSEAQKEFKILLESSNPEDVRAFESQTRAALENWYAKITGRLVKIDEKPGNAPVGTVEVALQFYGDERPTIRQFIVDDCWLSEVDFEIRVFYLKSRQRSGIRVSDAKDYLLKFGGVHIYDAGFHLPYYGVDTDWLRLTADQARSISRATLLPKELQVPDSMQHLPGNNKVFGVVHVNTSLERKQAEEKRKQGTPQRDYLTISVTRDRLVDNKSSEALYNIVRWPIEFYAAEHARRLHEEAERKRPIKPLAEQIESDDTIESLLEEMPAPAASSMRTYLGQVAESARAEANAVQAQVALLGPLATAGISALAYEHEVGKQLQILEVVITRINAIKLPDQALRRELDGIATAIKEWIQRARATRALFSSLMDEENRETRSRFKAKSLMDQVALQAAILLRGVRVNTHTVDPELRLPEGGFAEWSAIFQNVFVNAVNAMLDSSDKRISVRSVVLERRRDILIEDTGVGIDVANSESLFQPFVRKTRISKERRALGVGGTGLGLTIVRMLATNLGCSVSFSTPSPGYKTAFRLSWGEKK